jgi:hypothetical protein
MNGHMLVVRYLWLWGAGHFLQVGDIPTIFNPLAFATWLRGLYGAGLDDFVWAYPPSMLFLALPAGHAAQHDMCAQSCKSDERSRTILHTMRTYEIRRNPDHHCWTGEGHDRGATGLRKEDPNCLQGLELHAEV